MSAPIPSLYALTAEYTALGDLLEMLDEQDATDEAGIAGAIATWIAELDGHASVKLQRVGEFLRMQELAAEAAKAEARRLQERAAACARKVERIKAGVLHLMQAASTKSLSTATFSFTVAGNGGVEPMEVDATVDARALQQTDPDLVAVVVDHNAVRKRLKAGASLPFARLLPRGQHLRIR